MPHNVPHYICKMKIKFYLSRPNAKKETAIFATISYNNNRVKIYVGENINPKYWNPKTHRVRASMTESPEFNQRLEKITSKINKAFLNYGNENDGNPTPETLKEMIEVALGRKREENFSFLEFFDNLIERQKAGLRISKKTGKAITTTAAKHYGTTLNTIKAFSEKTGYKVDWKSINPKFYEEFTRYLTAGNLSLNTIGSHFKRIKTVVADAIKQGKVVNESFKDFAVQREDADNISLTAVELAKMEQLNLSENKRLETVRDLFLIGCHTGLRYSDFSNLKPGNFKDGFIHVTQLKTGGKVVIPEHPVVKTIFEKYNGVLPSISNQKTNDYLKEIGKMIPEMKSSTTKETTIGGQRVAVNKLRWEMLSTHTARRTFATLQYLNGVPSITIMAITGHRTERDFLKYIKVTSKEHAEKMKAMWAVGKYPVLKAV